MYASQMLFILAQVLLLTNWIGGVAGALAFLLLYFIACRSKRRCAGRVWRQIPGLHGAHGAGGAEVGEISELTAEHAKGAEKIRTRTDPRRSRNRIHL